ncbi:MAG: enoyl-CoA hydratase-related protein [Rhodoferax sp.]
MVDGPVAHVTLRDARRMNAMSRLMWRELRGVFERIAAQPALRAVLIAGQGAHFCAGGNIAEYPSFRFDAASLREFHEIEVWGALRAILSCDVPVLAQIRGNCMGAGVEIACCADLRIAAESAQFGAPIAQLGFAMAPRETALLLREAGAVVTRSMLLEAAVFSAPELLTRGFLTRVVPECDLDAAVQSTLARIVGGAPMAARRNKQTIRVLNNVLSPVESALGTPKNGATSGADILGDQAYAWADSAEHREGITAFLAKRKPQF